MKEKLISWFTDQDDFGEGFVLTYNKEP
jgi:hypothetical protein